MRQGPFLLKLIDFNLRKENDRMLCKIRGEITNRFASCTVEVLEMEWISNSTLHLTGCAITYPSWKLSKIAQDVNRRVHNFKELG